MITGPPSDSAQIEVIHIPYKIDRLAVELYFQLLSTLLGHQDHSIVLEEIEPDGLGGWRIHFSCEPATVELLRDLPQGDRSNPLWLLA